MAGDALTCRPGTMLLACSVLVATLAGCTGADRHAGPPSEPPGSTATAGSASESRLPAAPSEAPATSSGALTADSLPSPEALGPGWTVRVEGLDEEDGVGNGTPYQERDPREIVDTVLPMGCELRSPSPLPANVLQATYTLEGEAYAVALRLRFDSAPEAAGFADALNDDLRACRDQPDDPFSGASAPVLTVSGGHSSFSSEYQVVGERALWVKAVRAEDSDVLTLDTDAPPATVEWSALGYQSP